MAPKYQPRRKADENQAAALKKMRGREAFALLMAMRTRKTKVALDDFGEMELAGKVDDLLVIAPAGCYRTWRQAMDDDLSDDLLRRAMIHVYSSGSGAREKRALAVLLDSKEKNKPRVLLMNVEALSRPGPARGVIDSFMGSGKRVCVVIDESTCIKNKSKRTKFVMQSIRGRAAWRRILSGLASPRSPLDLYYQFEFLDWRILGHRSWWTFRSEVAYLKTQWLGGRSVIVIDQEKGDNGFRPEAMSELRKLIEPHSFRVEFRPKVPSTYEIRAVEMTDEQRTAYEEMRDFATTTIAGLHHVTATVVIAQIMRMHQILCGHVVDEERGFRTLKENRTDSLLELLEDYSGKAVIWCSYDYSVQQVSEALRREYGDKSVSRFWGGNLKTREAEEKTFKTIDGCRFMIATPDAGGKGRTWDMADLAVFYSSRDNLEHRDQAEQRTMGKDKTRGVDNVDLIVPGTIEEKILQALRRKINMATTINGDNYREWLI